MPKLVTAISSLSGAFRLCLFDSRYRRLALRPWLIGFVVYCGAAVGAVYAHAPILQRTAADPTTAVSWIIYVAAWIGIAVGLLVSTMIISVAIILVFSSLFQTDLAKLALTDLEVPYPADESSLHGTVKEAARTVIVETTKLLWLIPLGIIVFITGLFPILLPLTLFFVSWLLAYQFVDIVVDVIKVPPFRRLRYSIGNSLTLLWFGLVLAGLWAVPFLGFLLPPIAVVAAANYFNKVGLLERIRPAAIEAAVPPEPTL